MAGRLRAGLIGAREEAAVGIILGGIPAVETVRGVLVHGDFMVWGQRRHGVAHLVVESVWCWQVVSGEISDSYMRPVLTKRI